MPGGEQQLRKTKREAIQASLFHLKGGITIQESLPSS